MNNNYIKLIEQAHKLQLSNKLQEAKVLYNKLLGVCFDNMYLYFYYAQLNSTLKDYELSIKYYLKALELDKSNFDIIFNLSLTYKDKGDIDLAIEYALKAFDIKFDDYKNLIHLSTLYQMKDDIDNQFNYLSRAAFLTNSPKLFYACGFLAQKANNFDLAIELFQKVLELEPENSSAMMQIALIYINYDKSVALELFEELYNNNVLEKNVLMNLSILSRELNNNKKSLFYSQKFYELFPDDEKAICTLLFAYQNNNIFDNTLELSEKLYNCNPTYSVYIVLYATNLIINNQKEKAKELLSQNLDSPNVSKLYYSILLADKDFENSKEVYFEWITNVFNDNAIKKALKKSFYNNNFFMQYNVTEKEFIDNIDYSHTDEYKYKTLLANKQWKNEDITGKRILIYNPNGFGDFIMFSRYIDEVKKQARSVDILVKEELYSLVKYNYPESNIITSFDELNMDLYDYTTAIMSLIYNLNKDLYNIPKSNGYFDVDNSLVKGKEEILNLDQSKLNVGLCWQGNQTIIKNRSLMLEDFASLINEDYINIYSFQISGADKELEEYKDKTNIFDLRPYINDFSDTAAFLKTIDVLVTIDTSIVHLAGALGMKTYLILPLVSEWRWFNDTQITPWYDSVRIFKQTRSETMQDVISRVEKQLLKDYECKI